jgi:hypothetical protein
MSIISNLKKAILKPPAIRVVEPPQLESLIIQTLVWREYLKWIRDNDKFKDPLEMKFIEDTYKVLRQELKLRISIMKKLIQDNFVGACVEPLDQIINTMNHVRGDDGQEDAK